MKKSIKLSEILEELKISNVEKAFYHCFFRGYNSVIVSEEEFVALFECFGTRIDCDMNGEITLLNIAILK